MAADDDDFDDLVRQDQDNEEFVTGKKRPTQLDRIESRLIGIELALDKVLEKLNDLEP